MFGAIAGGKERLCPCASMGRDGAACSCDHQGRGHETAAARQLLVQGCLLTCRQRGCEFNFTQNTVYDRLRDGSDSGS